MAFNLVSASYDNEGYMSDVIKKLAEILMKLPSEFREDYPKSVPNYVIDNITRFNNTYKTNLGYIKNQFKKLEQENEFHEKALHGLKAHYNEIVKERDKLREALEFYANKRHLGTTTKSICNYYWLETGDKARATLKELYE